MSEGRRWPHAVAKATADQIIDRLKHRCLEGPMEPGGKIQPLILACGSLRRGRETVGDLDIVAAPLFVKDLFGQVDRSQPDYLTQRLYDKRVPLIKDGPDLKVFKYGGIQVDLYLVHDLDRWGWTVALRTGSKEWNQALLTPARLGGINQTRTTSKRGVLVNPEAGQWGEPIPTRYELDVFEAFQIPWVPPADRDPGLWEPYVNQ